MIKVSDLSFSFPQKVLFDKISFSLMEAQHCAFIGASGSGKSTLLNLLLDPEEYMFDGKLEKDTDCRTGYVNQFSVVEKSDDITVLDFIGEAFFSVLQEISSICAEMEITSVPDPLLEKYQRALDAYDAMGGEDFERQINKQLSLSGLMHKKTQAVSKLSGGEFKLVQIIKEMLSQPDLLMMDEPDVFLDFENLDALKNLINAHRGTLLVITHNRHLLNHCFNKIIHLENTELQEYEGRYVDYHYSLMQSKIELMELALSDDEEMERNEQLITKLRIIATYNSEASRGKALKARVKVQERLAARKIKEPFVNIRQPSIRFEAHSIAVIEPVLKVKNYSVTFDSRLLEHVTFEINSNDKAAIIGANGTGKTTLLRDIFTQKHDTIYIKHGTQASYLSQVQGEMLNEANTIYDELFEAGFQTRTEIASYASDYGFDEESLSQKISSLSGGEKNMLQFAKIDTRKTHLLLLDEPTSHLDTYSQAAFEKAIEAYKGAILMISHDFNTIVNCMDYVLVIEDKTIRKMSIRKFRKMVYADHYDMDYLQNVQKKKVVESKIEIALKNKDFMQAKVLSEELGALIKAL